jgi:methylase of polypeptide subunit release factors
MGVTTMGANGVITKFKNGTTVSCHSAHDGGGSTQYADFINFFKEKGDDLPKYKNCLEWCAGPGFIGYSLLDAEVCQHVTFMDIHEPAIEDARNNAIFNNLTDRTSFHTIDAIHKLPTDLKFDLVVANPPHSLEASEEWLNNKVLFRLIVDLDWKIHEEFFAHITDYLLPGAEVILSQTHQYQIHCELAEKAGLSFEGYKPAKILTDEINGSTIEDSGPALMTFRFIPKTA